MRPATGRATTRTWCGRWAPWRTSASRTGAGSTRPPSAPRWPGNWRATGAGGWRCTASGSSSLATTPPRWPPMPRTPGTRRAHTCCSVCPRPWRRSWASASSTTGNPVAAPATVPWQEWAARQWETQPRRYTTPRDLAQALDVTVGTTDALEMLNAALLGLMEQDSEHNALAAFLPPQEGKSQLCSRRLPEWALDHNAALRVGIVSYEMDLATRWGRAIKADVGQYTCPKLKTGELCDGSCGLLHIDIRRDSSAASRWETPAGGGVYCVGIGGALTGRPIDLLIVDDPVKDRAAAESEKLRNTAWDWWESVALTRLAPGARVVLVQTRWHEDDLAGRIFSRPGPLKWRKLVIPAIAVKDDPLGRAPGQELVSVRGREPGYFHNLQAGMSNYVFAGVFQQNPTAAEGNFFRRATFRYWRHTKPWPDGRVRIECEGRLVTMADTWRFATVDVAASTRTGADFTVVSVWAITVEGDLVLLERVRNRVPEHDHFSLVPPLRTKWAFDTLYIEKSWWSTTLVTDARAAQVPVAPLIADTDKVTRAIPAAGRLHAGKVWFPAETSGCPCATAPAGCGWMSGAMSWPRSPRAPTTTRWTPSAMPPGCKPTSGCPRSSAPPSAPSPARRSRRLRRRTAPPRATAAMMWT